MSDVIETDESEEIEKVEETDNDEETPEESQQEEEAAAAEVKEYSGRKIMCFVSKRMVPIEDTVEVEYSPGKSYRVLGQYVRFELNA